MSPAERVTVGSITIEPLPHGARIIWSALCGPAGDGGDRALRFRRRFTRARFRRFDSCFLVPGLRAAKRLRTWAEEEERLEAQAARAAEQARRDGEWEAAAPATGRPPTARCLRAFQAIDG